MEVPIYILFLIFGCLNSNYAQTEFSNSQTYSRDVQSRSPETGTGVHIPQPSVNKGMTGTRTKTESGTSKNEGFILVPQVVKVPKIDNKEKLPLASTRNHPSNVKRITSIDLLSDLNLNPSRDRLFNLTRMSLQNRDTSRFIDFSGSSIRDKISNVKSQSSSPDVILEQNQLSSRDRLYNSQRNPPTTSSNNWISSSQIETISQILNIPRSKVLSKLPEIKRIFSKAAKMPFRDTNSLSASRKTSKEPSYTRDSPQRPAGQYPLIQQQSPQKQTQQPQRPKEHSQKLPSEHRDISRQPLKQTEIPMSLLQPQPQIQEQKSQQITQQEQIPRLPLQQREIRRRQLQPPKIPRSLLQPKMSQPQIQQKPHQKQIPRRQLQEQEKLTRQLQQPKIPKSLLQPKIQQPRIEQQNQQKKLPLQQREMPSVQPEVTQSMLQQLPQPSQARPSYTTNPQIFNSPPMSDIASPSVMKPFTDGSERGMDQGQVTDPMTSILNPIEPVNMQQQMTPDMSQYSPMSPTPLLSQVTKTFSDGTQISSGSQPQASMPQISPDLTQISQMVPDIGMSQLSPQSAIPQIGAMPTGNQMADMSFLPTPSDMSPVPFAFQDNPMSMNPGGTNSDPACALGQVYATCTMIRIEEKSVYGNVDFSQQVDPTCTPVGDLMVNVRLYGFNPEDGIYNHGLHVHEYGDVRGHCTSAGPIYNPYQMSHGGSQSLLRHLGDFGNVREDAEGNVFQTFQIPKTEIIGPMTIVGKALVIKIGPDSLSNGGVPGMNNIPVMNNMPGMSELTGIPQIAPMGGSGYPAGCCVIGKSDQTRSAHIYNQMPVDNMNMALR